MGSKNCPETPRQKMINMMYIVLTAMLALNVASQVLEAFKVVDLSLLQTLKAVDIKNSQVYSSFDLAYKENPDKVKEWKEKSDMVKAKSSEMISYIFSLKENLVRNSGSIPVTPEHPLQSKDFYIITEKNDTLILKKEEDLNAPSEFMITQKNATTLRQKIEEFKNSIVQLIPESETALRNSILKELETTDPRVNLKEGGERKTWEIQHFLDKPLVAVLTLLTKMQIDVGNAESIMLNYLYSQIDASSFKFNKLVPKVVPKSRMVLQGDTYEAEIFMSAQDTTQQMEVFVGGNRIPVIGGKAVFQFRPSNAGDFNFNGLIKFKNPNGIVEDYNFTENYQVTVPSVTMSASKMRVFYRGLDNPFEVNAGGIASEKLEVTMTNGTVSRGEGGTFIIRPNELDENGKKTTVSVHALIDGQRRFLGSTNWRVKRVPDPIAKVGNLTPGTIKKEVLVAQDGILAVLENFDFDYKFTVTSFELQLPSAGGYTNISTSNSNRFTQEQKNALKALGANSVVYISNIKAKGASGESRELAPVSYKMN